MTGTAPTVAHTVIHPGDRVYLTTMHGGRMAAVVTGAAEWSPTGFPSDTTPYGVVRVTARRPSPGYRTGETVHDNDLFPRTGWRRSNGRPYRVGVSCLSWQPCTGCGRTTRVANYAVSLRHDSGTATVTVAAPDAAAAIKFVTAYERAPQSAVLGVTLTGLRYI